MSNHAQRAGFIMTLTSIRQLQWVNSLCLLKSVLFTRINIYRIFKTLAVQHLIHCSASNCHSTKTSTTGLLELMACLIDVFHVFCILFWEPQAIFWKMWLSPKVKRVKIAFKYSNILSTYIWLQTELISNVHFPMAHNYTAWSNSDIHCVRKSHLAIKVLDNFRNLSVFK